jgi:hypothetical protein
MWSKLGEHVGRHSRNVLPALGLFLASLATLALAGYPIYVIRPFREQMPSALERALWLLLHFKPILLFLALGITALSLLLGEPRLSDSGNGISPHRE